MLRRMMGAGERWVLMRMGTEENRCGRDIVFEA